MKKVERVKPKSLASQVKTKNSKKVKKEKVTEFIGNFKNVVSTGSLLTDLAISGDQSETGGIPGGVSVIIYGPPGGGKTAVACEFAGNTQRSGGEVKYIDAEGRLNENFAKKAFDLDINEIGYEKLNTITTAFDPVYKWSPDPDNINAYVIDSLAALSTEMELESEDKMGTRRAKEFSTHFRKIAIPITANNIVVFCTNQTREKLDAGLYERKDINPGGKALEFYASIILRLAAIKYIKKEFSFGKKKKKEIIGMEATVEVVKNSVARPFRTAPIIIYFDYGIDDISANLKYVKEYTGSSWYSVKDTKLSNSLEKSVKMVEDDNLEKKLRKQVISIWREYDNGTKTKRKKKKR